MLRLSCQTCDIIFNSRRSDGRWCSSKCSSRWAGRHRMGLPESDKAYRSHLESVLTKTCPTCTNGFVASRKQQTFCSNACTVRFRRRVEDGAPGPDLEFAEYQESLTRLDGLKTCPRCQQDLPQDEAHFYKANTARGLSCWCRWCSNQVIKDRKRKQRIEVLTHYSGGTPKCACCGVPELEFLAIDHVGGGGNAHRKAIGRNSGAAFYDWLRKEGYPTGYQVLCHNCNSARGFYGICPHERSKCNSTSTS